MKRTAARLMAGWLIALLVVTLVVHARAQGLDDQLRPLVAEVVSGCGQAGARRITVADFTDLQGRVTELGRFLAEELGGSLVMAKPRFGIVDRANLRAILVEHKLSMSGLVNPETAKRLGQIAGVDGIVTGTITPLGDTVRVSIKVVATDTATIMAAARADIARTKAVEDLLGRNVTSQLTGQSVAGESEPSGSRASGPVFQNRVVRVTTLSASATKDGGVLLSVQVENLTDDTITFWCHRAGSIPFGGLDLRDETGATWRERNQYFDFGSSRLAIAPGQPAVTAAKYFPSEDAGEGRSLTLNGVCATSVRGREASFPMVLRGLLPQR